MMGVFGASSSNSAASSGTEQVVLFQADHRDEFQGSRNNMVIVQVLLVDDW